MECLTALQLKVITHIPFPKFGEPIRNPAIPYVIGSVQRLVPRIPCASMADLSANLWKPSYVENEFENSGFREHSPAHPALPARARETHPREVSLGA